MQFLKKCIIIFVSHSNPSPNMRDRNLVKSVLKNSFDVNDSKNGLKSAEMFFHSEVEQNFIELIADRKEIAMQSARDTAPLFIGRKSYIEKEGDSAVYEAARRYGLRGTLLANYAASKASSETKYEKYDKKILGPINTHILSTVLFIIAGIALFALFGLPAYIPLAIIGGGILGLLVGVPYRYMRFRSGKNAAIKARAESETLYPEITVAKPLYYSQEESKNIYDSQIPNDEVNQSRDVELPMSQRVLLNNGNVGALAGRNRL